MLIVCWWCVCAFDKKPFHGIQELFLSFAQTQTHTHPHEKWYSHHFIFPNIVDVSIGDRITCYFPLNLSQKEINIAVASSIWYLNRYKRKNVVVGKHFNLDELWAIASTLVEMKFTMTKKNRSLFAVSIPRNAACLLAFEFAKSIFAHMGILPTYRRHMFCWSAKKRVSGIEFDSCFVLISLYIFEWYAKKQKKAATTTNKWRNERMNERLQV